jgi:hypothetical protein
VGVRTTFYLAKESQTTLKHAVFGYLAYDVRLAARDSLRAAFFTP